MRGIVVDDQMQIQVGWSTSIDLLEKLDPFLMAMPWHAIGDNLPFGQFNGGEQRGRAVAFVVVRECLQPTGEKRQALLCAIQGLDLALLITREDERVFRRIQIRKRFSCGINGGFFQSAIRLRRQ